MRLFFCIRIPGICLFLLLKAFAKYISRVCLGKVVIILFHWRKMLIPEKLETKTAIDQFMTKFLACKTIDFYLDWKDKFIADWRKFCSQSKHLKCSFSHKIVIKQVPKRYLVHSDSNTSIQKTHKSELLYIWVSCFQARNKFWQGTAVNL